jgi:hypothetical protein
MNIILCHPFDQDAIWLYLELKKGGTPVELLAPEQILTSREWTQSLDNGSGGFALAVRDGLTIKSGEIDFFFNRTQLVDAPIWRHAAEREREYVRSEMTAMLMSWLYQVQRECLMINPPVGHSLCGAAWSRAQWMKAAFDAGFTDAADGSATGDDKVLVVGGKVLSGLKSRKLAQRCVDLARIAQSPLLEIAVRDSGSTFTGANPLPAFRGHGKKFLVLIQHQLSRKTR